MTKAIQDLALHSNLPNDALLSILTTAQYDDLLFQTADRKRRAIYGDEVYLRGLVEFTNYCKNDCYYCGIRRSNTQATRYRMGAEEILETCRSGFDLGFRTFVLQGGEDPFYTDDKICRIVSAIRKEFPECAITLSLGEKSRESYKAFFDAGANRYLLRHETASDAHYRKLHPAEMHLKHRKQCLWNLKEIGYHVGAGFMVGSPYQTPEDILQDLRFLQELQPDMIGIGPFLSHKDTPFAGFENGSLSLTLRLIAVLRLLFPYALIPATTALGTIHPEGREMGLKAGANVVMPNISPLKARQNYLLYDNKICTGEASDACRMCMERRVSGSGYRIVTDIGNPKRP